jgi:hypothetical protein
MDEREVELEKARRRVLVTRERVSQQREIVNRLQARHGGTALGESVLKNLESELADDESRLEALLAPPRNSE